LPQEIFAACSVRLHQPQPRVTLGLALRGIAHSAIDISDGLLADLGHVVENSRVGAEIEFDALPCSSAVRALARPVGLKPELQWEALIQHCILAGGDDYELCFTVPVVLRAEIEKIAAALAVPLTRIGKIVQGCGCTVYSADGKTMQVKESGYDHFA
ncbi:MAG: AIR synthase-related protein, partial [Gallionellaceae bacterium]|jgi:thiamine-monophosphate kinase